MSVALATNVQNQNHPGLIRASPSDRRFCVSSTQRGLTKYTFIMTTEYWPALLALAFLAGTFLANFLTKKKK